MADRVHEAEVVEEVPQVEAVDQVDDDPMELVRGFIVRAVREDSDLEATLRLVLRKHQQGRQLVALLEDLLS